MTITLQHFYNVPESTLIPLRDKLKAFNETALSSGIINNSSLRPPMRIMSR